MVKYILLINVKMPTVVTVVGILILISRINTTSDSFKVGTILILYNFTFYVQFEFHAQLS